MEKFKLFLASSAQLRDDRDAFELMIGRRNTLWVDKGVFIECVKWENFLDALVADGLQAEYNRAIKECHLFVMLYAGKVGKYTSEEFEVAFGAFQESGRPRIFTYFNKPLAEQATAEEQASLKVFQDRLRALKHYQTVYLNTQDLLLQFGNQLDILLGAGFFDQAPSTTPAPNPKPNPATQKEFLLGPIIKLLTKAFDANAFDNFVLVNFEKVHGEFTPGMARSQRIQELVVHARNHGKLQQLLDAVEAENPYQFGQCGPYTQP